MNTVAIPIEDIKKVKDFLTFDLVDNDMDEVYFWLDQNLPENQIDNWDLWSDETWNEVYRYLTENKYIGNQICHQTHTS